MYRPEVSRRAQTMSAFSTLEWHRRYLALNAPVPPRNAVKSVMISIICTRKSPWGRSRTARHHPPHISVASIVSMEKTVLLIIASKILKSTLGKHVLLLSFTLSSGSYGLKGLNSTIAKEHCPSQPTHHASQSPDMSEFTPWRSLPHSTIMCSRILVAITHKNALQIYKISRSPFVSQVLIAAVHLSQNI